MQVAKKSCFYNRNWNRNNRNTCHIKIEIEIEMPQTIEIEIELATHFSYWNWNTFQNWNNSALTSVNFATKLALVATAEELCRSIISVHTVVYATSIIISITVFFSAPPSPIGACLPGSRPLTPLAGSGTITTPFFADLYPTACECQWLIVSSEEDGVSMSIL